MRRTPIATLLLLLSSLASLTSLSSLAAVSSPETRDTLPTPQSKTRWISQLIANGFDTRDTTIIYPAFPHTVVNLYNTLYDTFNGYDTAYVTPVPTNWMLQTDNYNWIETQTLMFPRHTALSMHSDLYSDAGVNLSFLIFSGGYRWNINTLSDTPAQRQTFRTSIICSRLALNYRTLTSHGGMRLTRFGRYNDGHRISLPFHDIDLSTTQINAYYFFNHLRYSHAAAYTYNRYQHRSAGSWLLGLDYTQQKLAIDFSHLPLEMLIHLPGRKLTYTQNYRDYSLLGGYAYNHVIRPAIWLINATAILSAGYKHRVGQPRLTYDTPRQLLASNTQLSLATVYNHRALYGALTLTSTGYCVLNPRYTHFSTLSTLTAALGIRF